MCLSHVRNLLDFFTLRRNCSLLITMKQVTCKPASSYKIVAIAVVVGGVVFALVAAIVAVAIRKYKQLKHHETFQQLVT